MEGNISTFQNSHFGKVRTDKDEHGNVLFCGIDIAAALGYARPYQAVMQHCRYTLKQDICTENCTRDVTFITESDVYRLIASSRLPSAVDFERWIFNEVLPTIRRTGGYVDDVHEFLNHYLKGLDENSITLYTKMLEAGKFAAEQALKQAATITEQAPAVKFANQVSTNADDMEVGDFAKVVNEREEMPNVGRNRLWAWMRYANIVDSKDMPYQRFVEEGFFHIVEKRTQKYYSTVRKIVMITGAGQTYLFKRMHDEKTGFNAWLAQKM